MLSAQFNFTTPGIQQPQAEIIEVEVRPATSSPSTPTSSCLAMRTFRDGPILGVFRQAYLA
jgi:hypothetical protein